jgi:hypothetical protein
MQSYDPDKVSIMFGDKVWTGNQIEAEFKQPWYKICPEYKQGHPDNIEGSTRVELQLEGNMSATIHIKDDSPSLEYLKKLDPMNWTVDRQMFICGERLTRDNFKELVDKYGQ